MQLRITAQSLSARRAWIEIRRACCSGWLLASLSARRAWIEIARFARSVCVRPVALRKESVDRNFDTVQIVIVVVRRSPQGERG